MATDFFTRISDWTSRQAGHPIAFVIALTVIIAWLVTGPIFHFSDTWQLVINTSTTIVTFLMVFLIQSTQNRESVAVQLKLDELIRASKGAHNALLDIENLSEHELVALRKFYEKIASVARADLRKGKSDLGIPRITNMKKKNPFLNNGG